MCIVLCVCAQLSSFKSEAQSVAQMEAFEIVRLQGTHWIAQMFEIVRNGGDEARVCHSIVQWDELTDEIYISITLM